MEPVTLSFSVKNIITVNLMLALMAGAIILATHALNRAGAGNSNSAQDAA